MNPDGQVNTREIKSREVAQRQKNNVISGFVRSLVMNTLIFIDASATWRLEWCTAFCSLLIIVILLFNLLFRSMSSFRGVRRTAIQMLMLRGSRGWFFFGFRSTRCGKSSACWLGLQRAPRCSLDGQYIQYSAKRGLQCGLWTSRVF